MVNVLHRELASIPIQDSQEHAHNEKRTGVAQAYGDQVDRVAQTADRLGAMVDAYRAGNYVEVK